MQGSLWHPKNSSDSLELAAVQLLGLDSEPKKKKNQYFGLKIRFHNFMINKRPKDNKVTKPIRVGINKF